jgi:hypothetical protein
MKFICDILVGMWIQRVFQHTKGCLVSILYAKVMNGQSFISRSMTLVDALGRCTTLLNGHLFPDIVHTLASRTFIYG